MGQAAWDFRDPSPEAVCMFMEDCLTTVQSPDTIKNYVSSLNSSFKRMGLDNRVFESHGVKNALLSMEKNIRHVACPSLPVTPVLLRRIVRLVRRLPDGISIAAAYVLMFVSFCRQSNFAAPSSVQFDCTRQFTRGDVQVKSDGLLFNHKWSKSHQKSAHKATVMVPRVEGSPLCPVRAMHHMLLDAPTTSPRQPLIVFHDGSHIPAPYLRWVWNLSIKTLNIPNASSYALHGLRRGAATHVISEDPTSRDDIKRHGLWQSDCVDSYLPATSSKVFSIMKTTL